MAKKRSIKSTTRAKTPAAGRGIANAGKPRKAGAKVSANRKKKPALLAGGNPQIPKGYGDAPVRAYIAAMPGWKRDIGRRLDALITGAVPNVRKAVKWNSPLYGAGPGEDNGWFLGVHCFANYVKVAFFRGASLRPLPPDPSTQKNVRYLDIREDDDLNEAQFIRWVKGEPPARRADVSPRAPAFARAARSGSFLSFFEVRRGCPQATQPRPIKGGECSPSEQCTIRGENNVASKLTKAVTTLSSLVSSYDPTNGFHAASAGVGDDRGTNRKI